VIIHGMMRNNPINQMLLAYSEIWLSQNMAAATAASSSFGASLTDNSTIAANLTSLVTMGLCCIYYGL
jgi:hypothetical protein